MSDSQLRDPLGSAEATASEPATSAEATSAEAGAPLPTSPETASLLELVDRLTAMLEQSDLVELEVEAGETGLILRKPAAFAPTLIAAGAAPAAAASEADEPSEPAVPPRRHVETVNAPLTGIYYSAPSPSSPPYVTEGQHVEVGQVIGLIEAMKLFNEIKSDRAGRVARLVAESGKLVKAKQPLIEV